MRWELAIEQEVCKLVLKAVLDITWNRYKLKDKKFVEKAYSYIELYY
jgi:hypothetical protein